MYLHVNPSIKLAISVRPCHTIIRSSWDLNNSRLMTEDEDWTQKMAFGINSHARSRNHECRRSEETAILNAIVQMK